jgi:hypothetical protein
MDTETTNTHRTNWAAQCRLAVRVSLLAALFAALAFPFVAETTIVVTVIVAGTIASWWQLETGGGDPAVVRARRH